MATNAPDAALRSPIQKKEEETSLDSNSPVLSSDGSRSNAGPTISSLSPTRETANVLLIDDKREVEGSAKLSDPVVSNDMSSDRVMIPRDRDSGSGPADTSEGMKKQYEAKLKDVMEKARDHAKKIANERDEFRRQCDEKESKLNQFKQLMNRATGELESKERRIRELEEDVVNSASKVEKVEEQMKAVESHYTDPPKGPVESVLSVSDVNGTQWILTADSRWWRMEQLESSNISDTVHLDHKVFRKYQGEVHALQDQLEAKSHEFHEYKRKVEILLNEKRSPSIMGTSEAEALGLKATKKIMKLENDLAVNLSTIEGLRKRNLELQSAEKNLLAQVNLAKAEIARAQEPGRQMERKIRQLEVEKKGLVEKLSGSRSNLVEMSKQLEDARAALALGGFPEFSDPVASTPPFGNTSLKNLVARSVQTDLVIHSIFLPSGSAEEPPTIPPSHNSQHDLVAIPLRSQIRQLMFDLETEREDHLKTVERLNQVREELCNREAEKKLSADLTDSVKVEYMRNVARRFVQLAPWVQGSDEFEQLVPVILNFFGLDGPEAIRLMKERRKARKVW